MSTGKAGEREKPERLGFNIPSAYWSGYEKAAARNPECAAKSIEHTVIDHPVADAVIEASMLDDLSYRIPDHVGADQASPW